LKSYLPNQEDWNVLNRPEVSLLDELPRREERAILLGKIAEYMTVSVFVLTLVAYEWAHWYFHWQPQPLAFGLVGLALVGYSCIRVGMMLPKLRGLKLEAAAATQFQGVLEQLSARGCYVFNRLAAPQGQRIATLVVSPAGVFCLFVRYLSRPGGIFESIEFTPPETLRVDGHPVPGNPCAQARRMMMSAYALLAEAGLETVAIQPVVVFPTWSIKETEVTNPATEEVSVWVVDENALLERLRNQPSILEPKTVIALCTFLEKRVEPA
jgi:hypothetical protein